ncbi:universal stress protein [Muricauda sp. HICW]|uniref:Universal stress protein n=1 Tax=Flagellimonas chongwuensis TaxID=2697365 RepID=A0A850NEE4_9FLAO|nr:universal stress protein [Allomuricauda chongwuensis]NVN18229.1 universal stress protein [Allomuricauda chongwuensis]
MEAAAKKYHISVLLDMSKSSAFVLTSALELAKQIDGALEVFHVNPYNTRNGKRSSMTKDYDSSQAQIKELIINMGKQEHLPVTYKMEHGRVKHRIRDYLALHRPDILVLGKRRPRFGIFSESITDFVINQTSHTNVLILGEDDKFHTFKDINLVFFGNELKASNLEVIKDLTRNSEKPVRHFDISQDQPQKTEFPWHKTVSYKFSKGVNALDGLVNYVSHTNIQLLCVPKKAGKRIMLKNNPIKAIIRKTKVPLLILPK